MARTKVAVTYLELTSPDQLRAAKVVDALSVRLVFPPVPGFNRRCYETIGAQWHWRDRLKWSDDDWARWLATPGVRTWEFLYEGEPGVGYAELATDPSGDTEIVYFGLMPEFIGRGMGGDSLTRILDVAWSLPSRRLWLQTCTLDAPMAILNYEARGFRRFKTTEEWREIPD
ncbi:MAG TPA: GNAT family N-acetyltransferase [Gemmatimonadales bacterium]|nr:GNAT family N-acetyltransferase [Gemmatimonadales bacterium]